MIAPIVWSHDRQVMSSGWVEYLGPFLGSTKESAKDRARIQQNFGLPAGQLWERLAEYAENHS